MIIRNAAKCSKCGDAIQSVSRHDFVYCKCKAIYVDGGNEYLRSGGDRKDFISLYVGTNKPFIPESVQLENTDVILAAHHSETCVGKVCALHRRTNHIMRDWVQSLENIGSTFVLTRICSHGIVHTDPDDYYVYEIDRCAVCDAPPHNINNI